MSTAKAVRSRMPRGIEAAYTVVASLTSRILAASFRKTDVPDPDGVPSVDAIIDHLYGVEFPKRQERHAETLAINQRASGPFRGHIVHPYKSLEF